MVRIQAGEEGMSPYERGRRRYKQADYTGAIEAFNEVGASILDLSPFTPLESLFYTWFICSVELLIASS